MNLSKSEIAKKNENEVKFTGIECGFIKKFLVSNICELKIYKTEKNKENLTESFSVFTDNKKSQEYFFKNNILKISENYGKTEDLKKIALSNEKIRVNFYFNKLGLYFYSKLFLVENGFYLSLPDEFYNVKDFSLLESKISVTIFYECGKKNDKKNTILLKCFGDEKFPLFEKPVLSAKNLVENDFNSDVKSWIEKILRAAKQNPSGYPEIGNGLFLISVGKYLLDEENSEIESVQGRKKAPAVIYLDENRIVFASKKEDIILSAGEKYEIQIAFPIPGPIKSRKLNLACVVQKIYENADITKFCADAKITEIKEEDKRFLSEKIKF